VQPYQHERCEGICYEVGTITAKVTVEGPYGPLAQPNAYAQEGCAGEPTGCFSSGSVFVLQRQEGAPSYTPYIAGVEVGEGPLGMFHSWWAPSVIEDGEVFARFRAPGCSPGFPCPYEGYATTTATPHLAPTVIPVVE
jgi:hypothetical protein